MTPLDDLLRALFAPLCHQLPERSWAPGGEQLALCQRCFGMYAGLALALGARLVAGGVARGRWSDGIAALMLAQVAVLGAGLVPEPAWLRTLSGACVGVALVHLLARPVRGAVSARAVAAALLAVVSPLALAHASPVAAPLDLLALAGLVGLALLAARFLARTFRERAQSQPARVTKA